MSSVRLHTRSYDALSDLLSTEDGRKAQAVSPSDITGCVSRVVKFQGDVVTYQISFEKLGPIPGGQLYIITSTLDYRPYQGHSINSLPVGITPL